MAHWAFGVNLILVFTCSDYRGPIYMGSNVTPWDVNNLGRSTDYTPCHNNVHTIRPVIMQSTAVSRSIGPRWDGTLSYSMLVSQSWRTATSSAP